MNIEEIRNELSIKAKNGVAFLILSMILFIISLRSPSDNLWMIPFVMSVSLLIMGIWLYADFRKKKKSFPNGIS
ncbi:hypothetical protein GWK91_06035 [Virgibacillus sp. MSP4-1]|uniref:hypothetical protein n=1 Tax=Virgibacillus sp. MSP4-1 TaxID=2700081 RepID=UPI0003A23DEE|nr:hypothetical protein [Virgibacillus sp. MSP4-1]QHS22536.1 hypothetical protein GWK91_06035 [Virgibacillus sp. MSP4-1]